jgi:hypothetical protein
MVNKKQSVFVEPSLTSYCGSAKKVMLNKRRRKIVMFTRTKFRQRSWQVVKF